MEAKGQLLPKDRAYVFTSVGGDSKIVEFKVEPNQIVRKGDTLAIMYSNEVHQRLMELIGQRDAATNRLRGLESQLNRAREGEKPEIESRKITERITAENKDKEIRAFAERIQADPIHP
jgi:hypothetical protein